MCESEPASSRRPREAMLELDEVRVASEVRPAVGKVASLQKRFEAPLVPPKASSSSPAHASKGAVVNGLRPNGLKADSSSADSRQLQLLQLSAKSSSSSESSGYDSLRQSSNDLDTKLASALEENDKVFKTFDTLKKARPASPSSEAPPSVMSRVRTFNHALGNARTLTRQGSAPIATPEDDSPPPPPPRTPVTRWVGGPKMTEKYFEKSEMYFYSRFFPMTQMIIINFVPFATFLTPPPPPGAVL